MKFGKMLLGVCIFKAALGSVATSDFSALLSNNPFLDVSAVKEKASDPTQQIELRGVIKERDGFLLNFYDPATKKSNWVKEGEKGAAFLVRHYDKGSKSALLESNGRNYSIALKRSHSGLSTTSSNFVASVAAELQAKAGRMLAVAPPDSEVARMAEVARLVQLRREERRQASRQGSNI